MSSSLVGSELCFRDSDMVGSIHFLSFADLAKIDKFKDVGWRPAASGSPVIDGVLSWIDCDIENVVEAGDHWFVMGRVRELEVETDHGRGLATRYGHLSEIDVNLGQKVQIGEVVGRIGSTGRSTGPHLHYETRIDGEAVDPQKFLRAGVRLGGLI